MEMAAGRVLTVTHGNGPQVGLLTLQSAAGLAGSQQERPANTLSNFASSWS
jgi:carbamate kinase